MAYDKHNTDNLMKYLNNIVMNDLETNADAEHMMSDLIVTAHTIYTMIQHNEKSATFVEGVAALIKRVEELKFKGTT